MAEAANVRNGVTPVAQDWNWKVRVKNELDVNKAWKKNWGFLAEQEQPQKSSTAPGGNDSLAAFMATAKAGNGTMSVIAATQRDSARARRLAAQDSLDGFVATHVAKADPNMRALPAQEFRKPLTTSHEYGWGRNLEVFGKMTLLLK